MPAVPVTEKPCCAQASDGRKHTLAKPAIREAGRKVDTGKEGALCAQVQLTAPLFCVVYPLF